METAAALKAHYAFTEEDARLLGACRPFMEPARELMTGEFYRYILGTPELAPLVRSQPGREERHKAALGAWFVALFGGQYDELYFANLRRVGETHVRLGLPGHFVNAGMNLLRTFGSGLIRANVPDPAAAAARIAAYDRILDMNLDVLTSSYREAELRKVFISHRLDDALLRAAERFSSGLKLVLVISLMGISLGVVALFVQDVATLVRGRTAHDVLTALGSLLIIWVMVELMENEIRQLRGGRFRIQIFLGVALVAFIREILISSLRNEVAPQIGYFLLASILTIGVVYWLISRAETQRGNTLE
jgi:uncharacterized membrane protein (DUF373 family)/hemoglobin-like flavoprotein